MRIKRTDQNFTVRQKAGRKIHYAGQGKGHTENTAHFSPEEKQGALRQKNFSTKDTGIQAKAQIQIQSGTGRDAGDLFADKTAESYQQGYGSSTGRNGSKFGDPAVLGNLHVKRPLQEYRKESVPNEKPPAGSSQISQRQYQGEQIHRPSSYHETAIKTKKPVLHRKQNAQPGIGRTGIFSRKGNRRKRKAVQDSGLSGASKVYKREHTQTKQEIRRAGNPSMKDTGNTPPSNVYAQPYTEKREGQISDYRREKYLKFREKECKGKEADRKSDTGRKTDTVITAGTPELQEICIREMPPPQMQYTAGTPAFLQAQGNGNSPASDASHLRKRNAANSIRKRDGGIPGRKRQDISSRKSGRKDRGSKKEKNRDKHTKKDNSHKAGGKSRKDRAAALRLLSYASDKFSMEEQKDSLLKVAGDLLALKIKSAAANALLSLGAALLPALIPAFIIVLVITLLFNSPFSILLPKLSEEPGAVEVLAEYTEDFRETVQEELADPGSGDETELIYEDYEGDGEPDNMADILMVYMVKHGFGDTATVMTEKNKRLLKDTFDEMTSLNISYRTENREQPYEEEDFWGNVTIKTEEVEVKVREIRVKLLTSEDIISTGIFTEEETEILRFLMSPEVLENIEGLTGGYGSPGAGSLSPEEAERLNLGGDTGSQAVKNALARLGKPYSQAKRDSGDYYDCSSLTYYSYKEAGITLSYHGSNTAASQGKLLSDRGCEVAYEDIQPGDLIFYSFTRNGRYQNISHVAVYAGNGYLVDASSSKGCVVFRPVYSVGKIVMCGRPSWL